MPIKDIKILEQDFKNKVDQLLSIYKIDRDLAEFVLDSQDNGDLEISSNEYKKAEKIFKYVSKTKYIGMFSEYMGYFFDFKNKIGSVIKYRSKYYDSFKKLENAGWKLVKSEKVVDITNGNIYEGAKPMVMFEADDVISSEKYFYKLTFTKDGKTYVAMVISRDNVDQAPDANMAAKQFLCILSDKSSTIHINAPAKKCIEAIDLNETVKKNPEL